MGYQCVHRYGITRHIKDGGKDMKKTWCLQNLKTFLFQTNVCKHVFFIKESPRPWLRSIAVSTETVAGIQMCRPELNRFPASATLPINHRSLHFPRKRWRCYPVSMSLISSRCTKKKYWKVSWPGRIRLIDPNRAIEVGDDHPRRIARTCQNHPGVKGSSSKRKNQIRF